MTAALALVGRGTAIERALATWWGEEHGPVALATVERNREQEYALASITNELWAMGTEHFFEVIDAAHATEITAFASEVFDRFQRCDLLVVNSWQHSDAPLVELSADEWESVLRTNLTVPFLALQAFGRLMLREGRGLLLVVTPPADTGDAAMAAAAAGIGALVGRFEAAWGGEGVRTRAIPTGEPPQVQALVRELINRHAS